MSEIEKALGLVLKMLRGLPPDKRLDALNRVRRLLAEESPVRTEPVDCVQWIPADQVTANDYNPNRVAPPEMRLLEHSIREDGYTQPIVAFRRSDGRCEVVDGFHRYRIGKESGGIRERVLGRLPVSIINPDRAGSKNRIAATIRHNRARGVHGIEPMAKIVARLYLNGWSNMRISRELGMERDEVLRLKQFTGLGTLFEHRRYSKAWKLEDGIPDNGSERAETE